MIVVYASGTCATTTWSWKAIENRDPLNTCKGANPTASLSISTCREAWFRLSFSRRIAEVAPPAGGVLPRGTISTLALLNPTGAPECAAPRGLIKKTLDAAGRNNGRVSVQCVQLGPSILGKERGLRAVRGLELAHDVPDVNLHGILRQFQVAGDDLV